MEWEWRRERFVVRARRCGRAYWLCHSCDSKQIWYQCDTVIPRLRVRYSHGSNFQTVPVTRHTRGCRTPRVFPYPWRTLATTIVTPVLVAFVANLLVQCPFMLQNVTPSTRISLPADARSETSRVILVVRNVGLGSYILNYCFATGVAILVLPSVILLLYFIFLMQYPMNVSGLNAVFWIWIIRIFSNFPCTAQWSCASCEEANSI